MSEFFMGQVMMTGFGFAQKYFARCDGAIMAVQQNQALFSLLGATFGGDGRQTFALPDLRGRSPAGAGPSADPGWQPSVYPWGAPGGVEQVSLTMAENGPHTHAMTATTDPGIGTFVDGPYVLAQASIPALTYAAPDTLVPLGGGPSTIAGGGQPHGNMQPYAVINFAIALSGVFPSRS
ncbi:tail fiber protein [Sphingomonas sp. 4RDLI-65]|uniref:phage tail protein n=1 Tax=Sphingomonas sp. 4RDLI-65 TaxID=3111641 RepID=UPI003C1CC9F8